ncbi:uncharacterized protein LOC111245504 [Varroa destructor]|uniref:Uncharacterized protein n=1 Tax=Varroa destructor TaxID=109461 RepID=A0A7M7JBQ2_VARDE|nr:uncharacterized protein LOC111245504 [Varroa destructor]
MELSAADETADTDLSHNKTWTPTVNDIIHWESMDQRFSLEKHKRPIYQIGDILSGTLRARVVPPNRVEKITRDDSALLWGRARVRSLPSRLFSKNISYQQKIQPLGTAKGKRVVEQRPVPGRSSSMNDISTEVESAAHDNKLDLKELDRLSDLKLYSNDEIVLTTLNVSTTKFDGNGNVFFSYETDQGESLEKNIRQKIIVPNQCNLCFDGNGKPIKPARPDIEADNDDSDSLNSLTVRSDSVSSISSSFCREAPEMVQSKTAVINEIIKALSSVSFEGSADLKPIKPVKQVEIKKESGPLRNLLSISPGATRTRTTSDGGECILSEGTQSLHCPPSHFKRSAAIEVLKTSRSCNDLNSNSHKYVHSKRRVVQEVRGPLFKNSHSQTLFRVEPIGVLWEMASYGQAVPLFAEFRAGQKAHIFNDLRRPRGCSLEENSNEGSSEDSMPNTSDKGIGPDQAFCNLHAQNSSYNCYDNSREAQKNISQRSRSEERGIAWEILLKSADTQDHMTLQEAFDAHCRGVKERSLSRLEKVAQIKMLRYDRDRIFEQYINMLPAHQKLKLDKNKVFIDYNGNQSQLQRIRKRRPKKQNSLEKKKKSNRMVADIYKNRVRCEVLAGRTTFPVSKIMLC